MTKSSCNKFQSRVICLIRFGTRVIEQTNKEKNILICSHIKKFIHCTNHADLSFLQSNVKQIVSIYIGFHTQHWITNYCAALELIELQCVRAKNLQWYSQTASFNALPNATCIFACNRNSERYVCQRPSFANTNNFPKTNENESNGKLALCKQSNCCIFFFFRIYLAHERRKKIQKTPNNIPRKSYNNVT